MPVPRCLLRWAVVIVGAGMLVGCGDSGDDDDSHDPGNGPNGDDDDDAIADHNTLEVPPPWLETPLQDYVRFSGEPGVAFAYRLGDAAPHASAAGTAILQTGAPLQADALFRVGSNTKPFVAVVTMQLVTEGRIDLDAPLTTYLPQYSQWSNVLIRHLLGMESGIADYLTNPLFWLGVFWNLGEPMTPAHIVFHASYLPSMFDPGTQCFYSNTNYVLLGMVIEAVTGKSAVDEIRTRVTEPLGLQATFLDLTGEQLDKLSHGYVDSELGPSVFGLEKDLSDLLDLIPPAYIVSGTVFDGTYLFHPSFSFTAGALVSNVEDLLVFMRAYVDGELVEPDLFDQMMQFKPCSVVGDLVDYGMAMMRRPTEFGDIYGHGGKHFGYSAFTYRLPERGLTFCSLNNFVPEQMPYFYPELMAAILGETARQPLSFHLPDDFFALDDKNARLRFRGVIEPEGKADPEQGLCYGQVLMDETWRPFYGLGCRALQRTAAEGDRLLLISEGPGLYEGSAMRRLQIELDPALLDELDDRRTIELPLDEIDRATAYLYDVRFAADTEDEVARCIVGVPDQWHDVRLAVNGPPAEGLAAGAELEAYGAFMVVMDPMQVQAYTAQIERPRCECKNAEGVWTPCGE